ncbi:hypothetical protein BEC79_04455 [Escherichia coli]|nr:hypothetical protein [Escherichia coli]
MRNILFLGLIQGSSFLLPLILLPFLIKTLGTETYGKMILYQVFFLYLSTIIDFGYNFSATQNIARNQNDSYHIKKVFSCTIWCKIFIFIIVFIFLLGCGLWTKKNYDILLVICFIPQLIGYVLTPQWLFQGIEKTNILAICTITARLFTTLIILITVHKSTDIYLAAFLQSVTFLLTAILSLYYIYSTKIASFSYVCMKDIKDSLIESFPFFISIFSVNLYTTLPALVIGVVLGNVNLAYYNIALTIRNALLGLFNPISQSLFPRVNNLYSIDQNRAYKLIKQSLIVVAVIFIFLAITTNIMSDFIVNKILGHSEFIVVSLVKMICFIPAISAINNILGIQTIILHGYKKLFSTVTIFYGVLNCIIIYPSLIYFGVIGAIYSSIFIELLIFITLALIVLQKKLLVAA